MQIEVEEKGNILLKQVYSSIVLESDNGERLAICMRDTGFEICYDGVWYEAKGYNGVRPLVTVNACS